MTLKALVIGAVLAALFSPAHADDGNGRYTIVPMPGHDVLVLLDTKTGQSWASSIVNKKGDRPRVSWWGTVFFKVPLPAPDLKQSSFLPPPLPGQGWQDQPIAK